MSKEKLTTSEWELVRNAPFWVNRAVSAADGRVAFFAKRREAKALEEAMKEYKTGNALLKDIVADDEDAAKEIENASPQEAVEALTRIAGVVRNKLGDADADALAAFLLNAGRSVAVSSRERGMGQGSNISDKEEAVLQRIEKAMKTTSAFAQAKPAPKPAATSAKPAPKPAPAPPKRDDEAKKKEEQEKKLSEARERQERAREKAEAKKKDEAEERLDAARKEAEERQREAAAEREASEKAEAEAAQLEAAAPQAAPAPQFTQFIAEHTVQPGDNLSFISERYYGTQANFRIIYEANRDVIGDNMNLIRPGQVLKIPKL
jgi:nucleoid-associated protein YgaU